MSNADQRHLDPDRRWRPILPAVEAGPPTTTPLAIGTDRAVSVACEPCRKRKSKCTGERPVCARCRNRRVACHYETTAEETHMGALKRRIQELQQQNITFQRFVDLLRSVSEGDAVDILHRMRSSGDIEAVMAQVDGGNLLLECSLVPESRLRYVFPFINALPACLMTQGNRYLESPIYEAPAPLQSRSWDTVSKETSSAADGPQSPYLMPYHAAELTDPRLSNVKASQWTLVISDDKLMRRILTAYFFYGYTAFPAFQKDHFIDDMVAGRTSFCSSLLVHAVLAAGVLCDHSIPRRMEHWNPQNLGYRFVAEAKRLWELETGKSKITTVQAAIVLHQVIALDGMDRVGLSYMLQALAMAHNLQLLTATTSQIESVKMRHVRVFTAWCLFIWQTSVHLSERFGWHHHAD